jgi:hypothetical protein
MCVCCALTLSFPSAAALAMHACFLDLICPQDYSLKRRRPDLLFDAQKNPPPCVLRQTHHNVKHRSMCFGYLMSSMWRSSLIARRPRVGLANCPAGTLAMNLGAFLHATQKRSHALVALALKSPNFARRSLRLREAFGRLVSDALVYLYGATLHFSVLRDLLLQVCVSFRFSGRTP